MDTLTAEYEFVVKTLLGKLNRSVSEALQPQFHRVASLPPTIFTEDIGDVKLYQPQDITPHGYVVIVTCAEALYRRPASVILSDQRHRALITTHL